MFMNDCIDCEGIRATMNFKASCQEVKVSCADFLILLSRFKAVCSFTSFAISYLSCSVSASLRASYHSSNIALSSKEVNIEFICNGNKVAMFPELYLYTALLYNLDLSIPLKVSTSDVTKTCLLSPADVM